MSGLKLRGFIVVSQMRKVELSISGVIKANKEYSKEFFNAYIFSITLASQVKHPIILNYKQQLTKLRGSINYSDYRFRKSLNNAIEQGLITKEGKHLRIWSKNQDKAFKPSKRNDYRLTSDVQEFIKLVLIEHHYKKQYHSIKSQTYKSINNSGLKGINYNISCSARGIAKTFNYKSSRSGSLLINYMAKRGHIKLQKNRVDISRQQFRDGLKKGLTNIRYDNGSYYMVLASTFEMKSNTRKTKFEKSNVMPESVLNAYLEMGYTIEQINKL